MEDRLNLLEELRIDRRTIPQQRRRWWPFAAVAAIAAAVSFGVTRWQSEDAPRASAANSSTAHAASIPTQPALRTAQSGALIASGYIVARRQSTVSAKVTGRVVEILFEEGQHVDAGEIIATLDESDARSALKEAQAELQQALARLEAAHTAVRYARPLIERAEKSHTQGIISSEQLDVSLQQFENAQAQVAVGERTVEVAKAKLATTLQYLEDTKVRAPFAGVLTVKAAQPGEIVSPLSAGGGFTRTGLGTIVDMDSLEAEIDVSESSISRVRSGQPAEIRLSAYPDWPIAGEVITVVPSAERSKGTVKVRVRLKEKDQRVVPEMSAQVRLKE